MSYKGIIYKDIKCLELNSINMFIDDCIKFKLKNENDNFNYIRCSEIFIHFKDYCKINGRCITYLKKSEFKIKFEYKTDLIPIKNNVMCYKGIIWKYNFRLNDFN